MLNLDIPDRELCTAVESDLVRMAASVRDADGRALETEGEPGWAGWDSLSRARLVNRVCDSYGLDVDTTVVFECRSFADLARQLVALYPDAMRAAHARADTAARVVRPSVHRSSDPEEGRATRGRDGCEPVAIVGMSLRLPQGRNLQQFWDTLVHARECVTDVPADRWDWRAIAGDPGREIDRTNVRWGAFIDGVAEFDPLFFGISPKEAEVMDPQQRLVLMCGVSAIEDAGYAPGSLAGTRTGVFVGLVSNNGYEQRVSHANLPIEGYSASASAASMGPNRLSYWLDLRGLSEPIETTCSSSLVAVHRAMRAIQDGDCDMALAGGVNLILSPAKHVSFSKAGMLSADGHCRPFSAEANGYVRGEGVAMLFLKALSAAERDGDEIYALLRGGAVNHGGRATSFSAPNPMAQAALLVDAYAATGIDPRSVGYIEAHGTGTPLGDPIEIDGLKSAFTRLEARSHEGGAWRCGIGSVKGNIGHLEAAAGVAGLIKVVAQLQHGTLVRSLNSDPRNPRLQLEGPFFLVEETQPWPAPADEAGRAHPRRAGVSSFGIGGVNAHVIVEEYVDTRPADRDAGRPTRGEFIVLSAGDVARLRDQASQLLFALREGTFTEDDLPRIAFTLQTGRDAMTHRLAFTAHSLAEVRETLAAIVEAGRDIAGVHRGVVTRPSASEGARAGHVAGGEAERVETDDDVLTSWTRGAQVDWHRLTPCRPRRIRLPTYPFARERCWVDAPGSARTAVGALALPAPVQERLHPLLHRNTSTLAGFRVTSQFTGEEPWLRDHVVAGRRVFPAAAYLEMARAAAVMSFDREAPPAAVLVQDVVWERPLYVEAPHAVEITITRRGDGRLDFEIGAEGRHARTNAHARGCVTVVDAPPQPAIAIDLPSLRRRCTTFVPAAVHYGAVEADGVAYGPYYRGVRAVGIGTLEDGRSFAVAELSIPPGIDSGDCVLPPTALDGALQAVMACRRATDTHPERRTLAMPFALQTLEVFSPVPPVAVVHVQAGPSSDRPGRQDEDRRTWDLTICDRDGRVCVRMRGLMLRASGQERNTIPVVLQPAWTPRPVSDRPAPGASTAARHVWLVGSMADGVDTLRTLAPHVTWHALPQSTGSCAGLVVSAAGCVFSHLQAHMLAKPPQHVVVQVVVPSGHEEAEALTALSGLFRTAHQESPYVRGQVVVLTHPTPMARLVSILSANARAAASVDTLIRHGDGLREVVTWTPLADEAVPLPRPPWRDGGVYLITGGSGRLARLLADDILQQAPGAHVVLASRTAAAASVRAGAGAMPRGGTVTFQEMDVTVAGSVQAAVQAIQARHGTLTGLVHCAGVIHDNFIVKKPHEEFRAVLAPKVDGIVTLDETTRSLPLECVILFSSIGSVVGNAGQSDYTTANAFLDWFAAYRNALVRAGLRQGRTLAINWPLWTEGGMGTATGMAEAGSTRRAALPTTAGLTALTRAWQSGAGQVVVVPEGYARLSELQHDADQVASAGVSDARRRVEETAPGELHGFAGRLLTRRLASLLDVAPERLDAQVSLDAYGLDSLTGLRVVSALEREFGRLPKTLLLDCGTLEALAQYFLEAHGETLRALRGFEEIDTAMGS
jgi:polyketide synthase PksN